MNLKKLTIIAMLSATAIAGRIALMAFPQVKPVLAIVIISGVTMGAGSGFLVGAVTMGVSNMVFGQGPLTVWQMLAAGLVGAFFGVFRMKNKWLLSIAGGLAAMLIYGLIMDVSSFFIFCSNPSPRALIAYCVAGLLFNAIHGVSTGAFLWALGGRVRELIERAVESKEG